LSGGLAGKLIPLLDKGGVRGGFVDVKLALFYFLK